MFVSFFFFVLIYVILLLGRIYDIPLLVCIHVKDCVVLIPVDFVSAQIVKIILEGFRILRVCVCVCVCLCVCV